MRTILLSKTPQNEYSVYLLQSLKDGNYYIGHTDDVYARLIRHNAGKVSSTRYRRPFKLIGYETYESRNKASWIEYNLKHHSDKKKKFINLLREKGLRPGGR